MLTFRQTGRLFKILTRNRPGVFCLTILLGFLVPISSAQAQSSSQLNLDAGRVRWTDLSFHAKNFWVEVSTDIQLRSLRAADLDAVLLKSPKGNPIKPVTQEPAQITIQTTLDPRFRSPVNIYNRIWFNPTDGSALGRIRLRRGEDDFKKMYRFTDRGVFRHRIEPRGKKETSLAPEKWTDIKDSFYPYDTDRLGCFGVTERSLLIYILSAADIAKFSNPLSLCVFGKRQLHHVQLRVEGKHLIKADYFERSPGNRVRIAKEVKVFKIILNSEPMESNLAESENFSFLGLQKDIAIYIDPASRLPLRASGIISGVGKVALMLHEVQFKPDKD
jgi:hypothetical protein